MTPELGPVVNDHGFISLPCVAFHRLNAAGRVMRFCGTRFQHHENALPWRVKACFSSGELV